MDGRRDIILVYEREQLVALCLLKCPSAGELIYSKWLSWVTFSACATVTFGILHQNACLGSNYIDALGCPYLILANGGSPSYWRLSMTVNKGLILYAEAT